MSIQRLARTHVDWVKFARLVPEKQKQEFVDLKAKHDKYLAEVNKYPETPPPIDWDNYKSVVPNTALVDEFKKNYDALKIPYPKDTVMADIQKEVDRTNGNFAQLAKQIADGAVDRNAKVDKWKQVPISDDLTIQEVAEIFPKMMPNFRERPVDAMNQLHTFGIVYQEWARAKKIHDAVEIKKEITSVNKKLKQLEADFEK